MKTHASIDERSLVMAQAIVAKVDSDPRRGGLDRARATCQRWLQRRPSPQVREWQEILSRPWEDVSLILTDVSEEGKRLRQNSPFCGILTQQERLDIYRRFS